MERLGLIEGIDLRVRRDGHGAPVVFVHGAMDRSSSFLRAVRHIVDHPVILYDRRGYGRSALTPDDAVPDFAGHVEDLRSILRLIPDLIGGRPLVVGHSLGGSISLVAASLDPDSCDGLLMFESPLLWEPWWPPSRSAATEDPPGGPAAVAERFMRATVGDEVWQALPESTRRRRRAEGVVLQSELRSGRAQEPPDLDACRIPVLVALGSGADPIRRRAAETLVRSLPEAELVIVDGVAHNAHSAASDQFAGLVRRLARRAASR